MEVRSLREAMRFAADKMQKNVLFDSPHFFCDVYCLRPGQEQRVHAHDGSDKVYQVLEGRGVFRIGDEERECGPGSVVIARSGVQHGVRNATGTDLALFVVMAPRPHG